MRVLAVTNMFPTSEEPYYGLFVKEQVEDLRELGLEVEVLSFDGRRSRRRYAVAARDVRRLARSGGFELVHAHYGLCGAASLAQREVPVVTTFHGSDFSGAIPWQAYVSWLAARWTTPIFVSTEGPKRLRLRAPVIPAGVDVDLFRPMDRAQARGELDWSREGRYVLFPGSRRNVLKRVDLFDAAVATAAADDPTIRSVYLEGYARAEVALVMNAVDVVMLTSDREGSPVSVREALACRTPVVSVPVGDVPRVLARLPGCEILPRDPRSLARGVLRAMAAGRPAELRDRAELSSRRRTAERVAQVYEDVLRR